MEVLIMGGVAAVVAFASYRAGYKKGLRDKCLLLLLEESHH